MSAFNKKEQEAFDDLLSYIHKIKKDKAQHKSHLINTKDNYKLYVDDLEKPSYLSIYLNETEKIGFLEVKPLMKRGELFLDVNEVFIEKGHRGKGLGKFLYESAISLDSVFGLASKNSNQINQTTVSSIHEKFKNLNENETTYLFGDKESNFLKHLESKSLTRKTNKPSR